MSSAAAAVLRNENQVLAGGGGPVFGVTLQAYLRTAPSRIYYSPVAPSLCTHYSDSGDQSLPVILELIVYRILLVYSVPSRLTAVTDAK